MAVAAGGDAARRGTRQPRRPRPGGRRDRLAWPAFNVADSCIVVGCSRCSTWWKGELETDAKRLTAGARDAGLRLDAFLAARGRLLARAAQRLIEAGAVAWTAAHAPRTTGWRRERVELAETGAARPSGDLLQMPRQSTSRSSTATSICSCRQACGRGHAPRARPPWPHAAEALGGLAAGGAHPERAGHRPPPRPRHLGPADSCRSEEAIAR